ncbi:MAG: PadR family transcriptional regulator [Verrucomicrobiota bacterium]|jgi:DNA-binding PadR family transcriptional regulator
MKEAEREILLSFWKVHILHHAAEAAIHGQWMLNELRHHGYEISPGTLYPILHRMARRGWLKVSSDPKAGPRARKDYVLTRKGGKVLHLVRQSLAELHREVAAPKPKHHPNHSPS